ncbi:MAG: endonuclease/exonuclease/phosphatase family protein [Armatimonadota bacterium]
MKSRRHGTLARVGVKEGRSKSAAVWVCYISAALLALCSFAFAWRPFGLAAITVLPVWFWWLIGLALVAIVWRLPGRAPLTLLALWMVYLLAFAEEPRSLARSLLSATRAENPVRVVSLNCAAANHDAAAEALLTNPDVVLYQESPGPHGLEEVSRLLFGRSIVRVGEFGNAILARGKLVDAKQPSAVKGIMTRARVRLEAGPEVELVSLRLTPAVTRLDYWNPACWLEHSRNRRARDAEMAAVAAYLNTVPPDVPVILGGDFNVPQGDGIFRRLRPRLRDAFREGGRGWGNTFLNSFPVLRIDQVWISPQFRAISVRAKKTGHSDHRMVICELETVRAGEAARVLPPAARAPD